MRWRPLSRAELNELIARQLVHCPDELRAYFSSTVFEPAKWRQSPYGDRGGGFWAVASDQNRVLWFNDIEDGFNVSSFEEWGVIPDNEYWCNQDELVDALNDLKYGPVGRMGPPKPGVFPRKH